MPPQSPLTSELNDLLSQLEQIASGNEVARLDLPMDHPLSDLAEKINQALAAREEAQTQKMSQELGVLRKVLDGMPTEIVILDPEFRYRYINPRAIKDQQVRSWLIGKDDLDYCRFRNLDLDIGRNRQKTIAKAASSKNTVSWTEASFRGQVPLHYLRMITPILNAQEEVEYLVGYGVDVTDIKQKEEELREKNEALTKTNRELDQFVYRASHDLRSPLVSIMGIVGLMEGYPQDSTNQAFIKMIKTSVTKLDTFIGEIVNYTRNARTDLKMVEVDPEDLIQESIEHLAFMEGSDTMDFQVHIDQDAVFVTDVFRMNVVLNNLISNAIKYRKQNIPDPTVSIRMVVDSDTISLEVEDNGIGIPEEHQEKVFSMFFRASNQAFGSGIGLYIVQEAIEMLQGKVELESTPGEGSLFRITFPNGPAPRD